MTSVWEIRLRDGSFLLVDTTPERNLAEELGNAPPFWLPAKDVSVRTILVVSVRPIAHAVQEAQYARTATEEATSAPSKSGRKRRTAVRGFHSEE